MQQKEFYHKSISASRCEVKRAPFPPGLFLLNFTTVVQKRLNDTDVTEGGSHVNGRLFIVLIFYELSMQIDPAE